MTTNEAVIYFRCPCADNPPPNLFAEEPVEESNAEEKPFNPFDARSNFSLFPLEHLLWCETCHDIRCHRCVIEEIVCWYCPSCGFEVAGSLVKSEGHRCTRNCYDCPSCTAPLFVTSLETEGTATPWILECQHCNWTSLDIGMTFEKPNSIHGQVAKLLGKSRSKVSRLIDDMSIEGTPESFKPPKQHPDARFASLMSFYKSELSKENSNLNPFASPQGADYSSPGSIARIMSLYTGQGNYGRKAASKPLPMRGAADPSEGLVTVEPSVDERVITRLREEGLSQTTNTEQRTKQPHNPRFLDEMLPQASPLATKRARRCRTCRHILVKPEAKVNTTRYRIKLVALNHIPSMTLKPLLPLSSQQQSSSSGPPPPQGTGGSFSWSALPPHKPIQLLLTLTNPMFEAIQVTLATPTTTPGPYQHKITILCPQFTMGANADIWDEALNPSASSMTATTTTAVDNRRLSKITNPVSSTSSTKQAIGEENRVAEAGKIWERGRNWTTVVVEVVCARIEAERGEDEDVLQIPLFVRLEYEQAVQDGVGGRDVSSGGGKAGEKGERVKRELAYWCVLGVGKVDCGTAT